MHFNHIGSRLSTETRGNSPRRFAARSYFNHIGSRLSTETLVVAALSIVLGAISTTSAHG